MSISISRSSNFYKKTLSESVDSAIAGLTASDYRKYIYTTQLPAVNPIYVRNTGCWAKNIDLSPLSPWNSSGNTQKGGTLISPRHIVFANHFTIPNGSTLIFVDMNNNCYIRTITNSLQVGSTDIRIGILDSDLPSNVSFCQVASLDLANLATNSNRIAVLYTDQEEKALVGDFYNTSSVGNMRQPTDAQRASFYEQAISGDSGGPVGFVYNNKLILLFTFFHGYGGEDGPSMPYYIDQINSVMTTLGGGYTLSIFNQSDIKPITKNISIKKTSIGGGRLVLKKFAPNDLPNLNWWLKSDDLGNQTFKRTYVSTLTLSGLIGYNGVYTAYSQPDVYGSYSLFSTASTKTIYYNADDTVFYISDPYGFFNIYYSYDGITWFETGLYLPTTITISGVTGVHSNANTSYGIVGVNDPGVLEYDASSAPYYILRDNNYSNGYLYVLFYIYGGPIYGTNSFDGTGAWVNINGTPSSVTSTAILFPNGTPPTSTITTSSTDTTYLASWLDRSGNGRNAYTNNYPKVITSPSTGKPAISLIDQTNLTSYVFYGALNLKSSTYFIVCQAIGNQSYSASARLLSVQPSLGYDYGTNNALAFYLDNNTKTVKLTSNSISSNYSSDLTTRSICSYTIDSIGNIYMFVNGNAASFAQNLNMTSKNENYYIFIGRTNDSNGNPYCFQGYISEVIHYNRNLSTAERQQVENYLLNKYPIQTTSSLLNGLIGYWNFNTNSWEDVSNNGLDLINYNYYGGVLVSNATGIISQCASFNGNNYFRKATPILGLGTGAFSVSFWLKANAWGNATRGVIDYKNDDDSNGFTIYNNSVLSTTKMGIRIGNVNPPDFFSTTSVTTNGTWQHWVFTRDDSGNVKWYLNGALDNTGYNPYSADGGTNTNLNFGFAQTWFASYNGYLDEVGIWNRSLSQSEITLLYNSGAGKTYPF